MSDSQPSSQTGTPSSLSPLSGKRPLDYSEIPCYVHSKRTMKPPMDVSSYLSDSGRLNTVEIEEQYMDQTPLAQQSPDSADSIAESCEVDHSHGQWKGTESCFQFEDPFRPKKFQDTKGDSHSTGTLSRALLYPNGSCGFREMSLPRTEGLLFQTEHTQGVTHSDNAMIDYEGSTFADGNMMRPTHYQGSLQTSDRPPQGSQQVPTSVHVQEAVGECGLSGYCNPQKKYVPNQESCFSSSGQPDDCPNSSSVSDFDSMEIGRKAHKSQAASTAVPNTENMSQTALSNTSRAGQAFLSKSDTHREAKQPRENYGRGNESEIPSRINATRRAIDEVVDQRPPEDSKKTVKAEVRADVETEPVKESVENDRNKGRKLKNDNGTEVESGDDWFEGCREIDEFDFSSDSM